MKYITIDSKSIIPIYEQLKNNLLEALENGTLKLGDRIPSINKICKEMSISPGTVIKAYDELCALGILGSRKGKGYYIAGTNTRLELKVFLLFDRLNAYKEILYEAFMNEISEKAQVHVFFHHYDINRFAQLINDNIGKYGFYVIMPHFNEDVSDIVSKIPEDKLLLIDRDIINLKGKHGVVCQNFKIDIFKALESGIDLIKKYEKLNLVLSKSRFQHIPHEMISGFNHFVKKYQINASIIDDLKHSEIGIKTAWIVFPDSELIMLIKKAKENNWEPGKDIGIISVDDTLIKDILAGGITVMSTDFELMGKTAAQMILTNKKQKIHNPFKLIVRNSL